MKKQKIHLIVLLIVLGAALLSYLGVTKYNEKKEEEEKAEEEASTSTALELNPDDIVKIDCSNDAGSFSLTKDGDTWTFTDQPDEEVDTSQVDTMLDDLEKIESDNEITDVTDFEQYGVQDDQEDPTMSIVIEMSDGTTHTIIVGDYNDTISEYYMRVDGSKDTVYTLSTTIYSDFNVSQPDLVASDESVSSSSSSVSSSS